MVKKIKNDVLEVFLWVMLVAGGLLVVGTEILSACHALTRLWVGGYWLGVLAVLLFIFSRQKNIFQLEISWPKKSERALLVALVLLALVLSVQGVMSAPNTFDSMVYHLSRVMHWAQNRDIEFYPTIIERQLWMPPWAEYAVLHLYLLTGSDRLAFLVQWVSYLGCVVLASYIAALLGANRRFQLAAALVAATIPMALLQAVSTQTDLAASFWGMSAVAFFLLWHTRGFLWRYALGGALALGLGVLTKMSVFLALPMLIFVLGQSLKDAGYRRVLGVVGLVLVVVFLVNVSHGLRVYRCFHSLNPASTEDHLTNEDYSLKAVVSIFLRQLALNLTTSSDRVNALVKQGVVVLHEKLGVNPFDVRINLNPHDAYLKKGHVFYESRAPNGFHLWLGVLAFGWIFLRWRRVPVLVKGYALSLATGFVLLCFVMKWQPWGTRFQLLFFLLGSPLVAVVAIGISWRWAKVVLLGLFVSGLCVIIFNVMHPWMGPNSFWTTSRQEQYFLSAPEKERAYTQEVRRLISTPCKFIGLDLRNNESFEYPWWVLLHEYRPDAVISAVSVPGPSAVYRREDVSACVVLSDKEGG